MDENSWVELPTITPNHLIQSRRIRHVLTGDLDYNIMTCPKFDGKEKEYVRVFKSNMMNSLKHKL